MGLFSNGEFILMSFAVISPAAISLRPTPRARARESDPIEPANQIQPMMHRQQENFCLRHFAFRSVFDEFRILRLWNWLAR
jgi:hypothetical protein